MIITNIMKKRLLILICCCPILLSCVPAITTKNIAVIVDKKSSIQEPNAKPKILDTKTIIFKTKAIYETSDASKNSKDGYFINFKYPNMHGLANQEIQNNINNDIKAKIEILTKNYQKDNQVVSSEFFNPNYI